MSSAVPEIIQRFRARELKRLVDKNARVLRDLNISVQRSSAVTASGMKLNSSKRPTKPAANLENLNPRLSLSNPFLPRPLFDRAKLLAEKALAAEPAFQRSEFMRKMQMSTRKLLEEEDAEKKRRWQEGRRWAKPAFSLRRQKELVKKARESGTLHLLPPGPKLSVKEWKEAVEKARLKEEEAEAIAKAELEGEANVLHSEEVHHAREGGEGAESAVFTDAPVAAESEASEAKAAMSPTSTPTKPEQLGSASEGFPRLTIQYSGTVPEKAHKRLTMYTGRKRMFKGHKWERNLQHRRATIRARVRDMTKRISRFRTVYKRKKPRPLQAPPVSKKEVLPF